MTTSDTMGAGRIGARALMFAACTVSAAFFWPLGAAAQAEGFNARGNILIADQYNNRVVEVDRESHRVCLLYTSPSPRDGLLSRMPSSA